MSDYLDPDSRAFVEHFMQGCAKRNPGEPEFLQAVSEVAESVAPYLLENPKYRTAQILERMTEPDRVVMFRVTWEDDHGNIRANRAWRVQFNNAIGPYKGGLRFHRSVNLSILKFLGFEQVFKNSLTGLPMGGAKGGANFNPRDKSEREVMRFCHALMSELHRHIGDEVDVPAGDLGVGAREISFLFGQYKRLVNRWEGVLTGKGLTYGGSLLRKEATGYGAVFFAAHMLADAGLSIAGRSAAVSGSGNVALYTLEKLIDLGAKPLSTSDSDGCVYDPDGIDRAKLEWLKELKQVRRGRVREYAEHFGCEYTEGAKPWSLPCELALPCATQGELDLADAEQLIANGVRLVAEGANMPCSLEAARAFREARVPFGPGKAVNAGGVAVSGLELSQNAQRLSWSRAEVCERLQAIMAGIHAQCLERGGALEGVPDYVRGANLAGFQKVADSLLAYGAV